MKNFVDSVSPWAGPLCLIPLLILWVSWSGAHQSSFHMFITRELIVLIACVLAIVFSVRGFTARSPKVKFLNVTTIVLATILGFLFGFSLL